MHGNDRWMWPWAAAIVISCAGVSAPRAEDAQVYGFAAAATEITQLYWLAETASACGWASQDDAESFKHFALRFLSAHLEGNYRLALLSMVAAHPYEQRVREAAYAAAQQNCESDRWRSSWSAYKAAAEAHRQEF